MIDSSDTLKRNSYIRNMLLNLSCFDHQLPFYLQSLNCQRLKLLHVSAQEPHVCVDVSYLMDQSTTLLSGWLQSLSTGLGQSIRICTINMCINKSICFTLFICVACCELELGMFT